MATTSEYNQFRRLIGDWGIDAVDDSEIDEFLDDAVYELTADFITPVTNFDILVTQYRPEVVYKAAINYWWNKASKLSDKHSQSAGAATQNVSEKWDRAMEMIRALEERFEQIQTLGTDITIGNFSRFSKSTLTRLGGSSEESKLHGP